MRNAHAAVARRVRRWRASTRSRLLDRVSTPPCAADLEAGDDPALLKSEDAVDMELMQRRKEMPLEPPPGVQLE